MASQAGGLSFESTLRGSAIRSQVLTLIPYNRHRGGRVYDVDLAEPPVQRWRSLGRELGDELHELLADVVELCEENLSGVPSLLRPLAKAAMHGASRLGGSVIGTIAGWCGGEYVEEIAGLAKTAEVPFSQVLLSNLTYDLTQISQRWSGASACSSYSCNVRGKPVLARCMDWSWPSSTGSHTVVFRFHRGRESYLSIGIVGLVGVLSAMYEGHWAVTLNMAPTAGLKANHTQWPALQRLRAACDGLGSFRGLVRRISEYRTMSPFHCQVIGIRPEDHVVIDGFGTEYGFRRTENGRLIQTNHYVGDDVAHMNPVDGEFEDEQGQCWYWDTYPRYRALERRLKDLPRTLSGAMAKLARPPVTHEGTQQRMVLNPATGKLLLEVRVED
jgi:hypothetical protein